MRSLILLICISSFSILGGSVLAEEPSVMTFLAYEPAYYHAYFTIAAEETFEPGLVLTGAERTRVNFNLRLKSAEWARAVAAKTRLTLSDDHKFHFAYPSFKEPPKGGALLDLKPVLKSVVLIAGSWKRSNEKLILSITNVGGEAVTGRPPWHGTWQDKDVMLDSLGHVGPMLVLDVHLRSK